MITDEERVAWLKRLDELEPENGVLAVDPKKHKKPEQDTPETKDKKPEETKNVAEKQ